MVPGTINNEKYSLLPKKFCVWRPVGYGREKFGKSFHGISTTGACWVRNKKMQKESQMKCY
jgi:hypothetical protein